MGGNLRKPAGSYQIALTERELEVLQTLIDVDTIYSAVAKKLVIAPCTVRTHINNLFRVLRVSDKGALVIRALQLGLAKLPPMKDSELLPINSTYTPKNPLSLE